MCEQCNLLRSHMHHTVPTPAHKSVCGACALPYDTTSTLRTCAACIVYALLNKNTFLKRWNDIQTATPPVPPLQAHRSVHHPFTAPDSMPNPPRRRLPTLSAPLPGHVSQPHITLTLTIHVITVIEAVLSADTTTHTTAHVHLSHPTIPLNLGHM